MISFTVYGTPVPQGSMRTFHRPGMKFPILTSDNKKLKPWRQEVALTATCAMGENHAPMMLRGTAVRVEIEFHFSKPKSTSKKIINKTTKPDIDKLCRSCLDAITGIVVEDDSQVIELHAKKCFGLPERTEIKVWEH